jgi:hypothetical protein
MAFDPSVIGTIGPSAMPDIAGATTKAFQLKDLMQEGQLHALQLKDYKTEQADRENVKDIISKAGPIDSMAKANEVTEQIRKINPDLAMKFHQQVSQTRNEDLDTQIKQAQLQGMQVNSVLSLITPLANQLQQAGWKQGQSHQILDDAVRAKAPQLAQQLKQQHPELSQAIDQTMADPQHLTADAFMDMWKRSGEAKSQLERSNIQSEITRREDETKLGREKFEWQKKQSAEAGKASGGAVGMILSGMPLSQAIPGIGKDAAARRQKAQEMAVAELKSENPEWSDVDAGRELARRTVEFSAGKMSTQQLTKMEGATRQALGQLDFNVDKSTEFMKKVPSTDLSPVLNAIVRKEETWTGNPNIAPLFFYLNATAQEAARIQSGGQASAAQLHQGAAEEAKKWLDAGAITPASWAKLAPEIKAEGRSRLKTFMDAKAAMAKLPGEKTEPETSETKTYQGKTYRLKPGADRSKKDSWELVGG